MTATRLLRHLVRIAGNTVLAYVWAGVALFGVLMVSQRLDPAALGDLGLAASWTYLMFWLAVGVLFVMVAMALLDLALSVSPWPRRTAVGLALLPGAALTGLTFLEPALGPIAATLLLTGVLFGSTALLPPARSAVSGSHDVASTRSRPWT